MRQVKNKPLCHIAQPGIYKYFLLRALNATQNSDIIFQLILPD